MNTYTIVMDNRELAAENSSTLISDLPMGNGSMGNGGAGYMQMNVHPNPYGNAPPNMNPVPHSGAGNMLPKLGGASEPEYRLPSRDIPIDTMRYNIDEQTRPNYIPVSSRAEMDYLRDVDDDALSTVSTYGRGREKRPGRDWNAIIAEIQMPLLVGILFFVFQSVAIDRLIVRYLAFLSPMATDGNLNLNGLLLKSAAFAGIYYLCMYAIENV